MDSDRLEADYRKNGYIVIPNGLSSSELADLRDACETLLNEDPDDDGGGKYHDIGRGEARRFLRHRHGDFPKLEAFLFSDKMRAFTEKLVGDDPQLFNEQFVVKGADKGASFAWHQDGAYVGFDHKPYITVWIALDDTTEENGCVYVLPRNLDQDQSLTEHEWDDAGKEKVGYFGEDPGIPVTCPAGTVVAFSSTTLHRSGENSTGNRRRAYVCQYSTGPIIDPETGKPKHFSKSFQ